jgi:uncharacterized coiled-coil DUF342 family protein
MEIPVIGKALRNRRINRIVSQIESHETAMRDLLHALGELTDEGDDLHAEVRRLLTALDG